jgi:AmmeMemoRadiSam system protein A
MTHPLVLHARRVIEAHLGGRDWRVGWQGPGSLPPQGCFVSLKIGRQLRGCIGTILPVRATLEEEIAENAIAAATRDPRFHPLLPREWPQTRVSIDLLSQPEPVPSARELDPRVYGLVVRSGSRSGVLLPDLPGVGTVARQIAICREKAGIAPEGAVTLSRFTVERLLE